jgi:hypothetical protein
MAVSQSANIGANFSNYTGDPALGGYGLGAGRIDTRAIEDLARYTMLYNREEYLRRQKEQEKAAEELIKFSGVDLSTTIPKDAKILQEKYDKVIDYVRKNPDALNYAKDKQKWLEYNKMKSDLLNDVKFAGIRSVANVARKNQIASETNEEKKKFFESELQNNIEATNIRTPLDFVQKYDVALPEIGANEGVKIDVTKTGSNQIFQRGFNLFDVKEAERRGAAYAQGFAAIDPATKTGQLKLLDANENFWRKGSTLLNEAIAGAKDPQSGKVDVGKLSDLPIMKNVEAYNEYARRMKESVTTGLFTDQFGKKIKFLNIPFAANDYKEIDLNDGLSPVELYKVAEFSKWGGDSFDTKVIQTDDEIQRANLGAEWARIGIDRDRLNKSSNEDLISATAVLREAADVLKNGSPRTIKWQGGERNVNVISDPNLLREFGTIDKDGTTTNVPDNVYYDKGANKLSLIYYKREPVDPDDPKAGMKIVEGKRGDKVLDRAVDLSATQWLGQIVRRKNPNADIGGVNSLIEQFFNTKEVGRKLENINKIYGTTAEGTGSKSESESASSSSPATDDDGKLTDAQYYQKYKKFRTKQ